MAREDWDYDGYDPFDGDNYGTPDDEPDEDCGLLDDYEDDMDDLEDESGDDDTPRSERCLGYFS